MKPVKTLRVPGFRGAGLSCGLKKSGKPDLALVVSDLPCVSDVVFTKNKVFAAPVAWGKGLKGRLSALRGIVVNSGNANACTGAEGLRAVRDTATAACAALALPKDSLLVSSTGVIGLRLPVEKIVDAIPDLVGRLSAGGILEAGDAMLTTDAFPKRGIRKVEVAGGTVTIGGIAKGAGMIAPNMGTMLGYVFTDASISAAALKAVFRDAVDRTFNRIVVDGDTSTNDTAAIFANGACGLPPLSGKDLEAFAEALRALLLDLALMIVRDGEGATRVVRIAVTGAKSDADAEKGARAVATSPLVKTMVAGADANWGRVIAAVGRAGIPMRQELAEVSFAGETVLKPGMVIDTKAERRAVPKIRKEAYEIRVDLGMGGGSYYVYFSDLTHAYIDCNAGYRS